MFIYEKDGKLDIMFQNTQTPTSGAPDIQMYKDSRKVYVKVSGSNVEVTGATQKMCETFCATASQTDFVLSVSPVTAVISASKNGSALTLTTDYTVDTGNHKIVLTSEASDKDIVTVVYTYTT